MASDCVCMCVLVFDLQDTSTDGCLYGEGCFLSSEGWASCAEGAVTVGVCTADYSSWILLSTKQKGKSIHSYIVKRK